MSWVDLLHLVFCAANPNPDIDSAVWVLLQVLAAVTTHDFLPSPSNLARVGFVDVQQYVRHLNILMFRCATEGCRVASGRED